MRDQANHRASTRRRSRAAPGLSLFLLLCASLPAFAADPADTSAPPVTSSLNWVRLDGAEGCPAAPTIAAAVEARLGRSVFVPPAEATLALEGRAERIEAPDGPRWRAVVRVSDRDGAVLGDRTVESRAATCDELGEVVAVTLALMIDPLGAPPPPTPPPPTPPPVPPAPPRWRFEIQTALSGGLGLVPGVSLAGRTGVMVTPPGFLPILAEGELIAFARAEGATTVDLTRAMGGLALCPLDLRSGRFALRGCVGVDAGALLVLNEGQPLRQTEWVLVQGHASLRPRWQIIGPVTLGSGLHVFVPFRAVTVETSAGEEIYAAWPVAALVDLGVGVAF